MKLQLKITIGIGLGALVVGTCAYILFNNFENNPISENINTGIKETKLPLTIFDGRIKIPSTNISVSYPTKGFYGVGVKFIPYNMASNLYGVVGGIGITVPGPIDTTRAAEYIGITLDVRKLSKNDSFNNLIKRLNDNTESEYRPNGTTKTIGEGIFYVSSNRSDGSDRLDAYTQRGNQYVHIGFQYSEGLGAINTAAANNNEKLFYEYLSNLNIQEK
jgi:hypothetical protein